jgi:hypothetical protein
MPLVKVESLSVITPLSLTYLKNSMQFKEVHFIRKQQPFMPPTPEKVETEVIIVDDLVVIAWDEQGLHAYYKTVDEYVKRRFQHTVNDVETDVMIVNVCDI